MSEEAAVEPGALEKKIIRQVEFYFGDRNLRRDKFLLEQIKKDDGCIQLIFLHLLVILVITVSMLISSCPASYPL